MLLVASPPSLRGGGVMARVVVGERRGVACASALLGGDVRGEEGVSNWGGGSGMGDGEGLSSERGREVLVSSTMAPTGTLMVRVAGVSWVAGATVSVRSDSSTGGGE